MANEKIITLTNLSHYDEKIKEIIAEKADIDDIPTDLSQLSSDATHRTVTDSEKTTWDNKQDTITDLETIRSGAGLGATAVQPAAISDMASKTWVEGKGYITSSYHDSSKQDTITDLSTIRSGAGLGATAVQPAAIADMATKTYVDNHHDSTKQDVITDLSTIRSGAGLGATSVQPAAISDMASKTWVGQQGYITTSYHDSSKQDTLVSGTNIKTVGGQNLLGSGDIPIGGSYTAGNGIDITDNEISLDVAEYHSDNEILLVNETDDGYTTIYSDLYLNSTDTDLEYALENQNGAWYTAGVYASYSDIRLQTEIGANDGTYTGLRFALTIDNNAELYVRSSSGVQDYTPTTNRSLVTKKYVDEAISTAIGDAIGGDY